MILSICVITVAKGQAESFSWPGNAKAAICLTYDDGMDTQLNDAIPDLDNHNLKGTFYLQGDKIPFSPEPGGRGGS